MQSESGEATLQDAENNVSEKHEIQVFWEPYILSQRR
jgi:hypothetical protein